MGIDEKGYDKATDRVLIDVNPGYFRPAEVEFLWGDSTKAQTELGWKRKIDFQSLVKMMVAADMKEIAGIDSYTSGDEIINRAEVAATA